MIMILTCQVSYNIILYFLIFVKGGDTYFFIGDLLRMGLRKSVKKFV